MWGSRKSCHFMPGNVFAFKLCRKLWHSIGLKRFRVLRNTCLDSQIYLEHCSVGVQRKSPLGCCFIHLWMVAGWQSFSAQNTYLQTILNVWFQKIPIPTTTNLLQKFQFSHRPFATPLPLWIYIDPLWGEVWVFSELQNIVQKNCICQKRCRKIYFHWWTQGPYLHVSPNCVTKQESCITNYGLRLGLASWTVLLLPSPYPHQSQNGTPLKTRRKWGGGS